MAEAVSKWGLVFFSFQSSFPEGGIAFCTILYPWKLSWFLFVFDWFYFKRCITSFFFIEHNPLCTVFNAFSSNIDQVLQVNPSPNLFVFEDNVHPRDWLTCSDSIGVTSFGVFFFLLSKTILFVWTVFDAFFINYNRFSQPILLLIYLSLEI